MIMNPEFIDISQEDPAYNELADTSYNICDYLSE